MTFSRAGRLNGDSIASPSFAAGIAVPDTRLAPEAAELVRDTAPELIYHHSRRVYWFGSLQGGNRGLSFDPELLYIGAMFHDVGLGEPFRADGRRFEVDSADEARGFLQRHGVPEDSIRRVWTAIAVHTTPGIPEFMEPEVALVTAEVEYDVLGIGYGAINDNDRGEITALHPRPDFKRRILEAFTAGIASKPEITFGNVKADVLDATGLRTDDAGIDQPARQRCCWRRRPTWAWPKWPRPAPNAHTASWPGSPTGMCATRRAVRDSRQSSTPNIGTRLPLTGATAPLRPRTPNSASSASLPSGCAPRQVAQLHTELARPSPNSESRSAKLHAGPASHPAT